VKHLLWTALGMMAGTILGAGTPARATGFGDEAKDAARKLGEQSSYTWTSTTRKLVDGKDAAPDKVAPISEGRIEKAGATYLILAKGTPKSVEVAIRESKVAVKTPDGWKSLNDFAPADPASNKKPDKLAVLAKSYERFTSPSSEVVSLVEGMKEMKGEGDGLYSGQATEDARKAYLVRTAKPGAAPKELMEPKLTLRCWVKDGMLVKYEVALESKKLKKDVVTVNATVTTVELREIGSTKAELPEEARKKL